jgi:hypothetical protein
LDAADQGSGALKIDRSASGDFTTWTSVTLPTLSHTSAWASDVVATTAGPVVIVGGEDAFQEAWTSTNNGSAFTRHVVGVDSARGPLRGVAEGKNGRIFAWCYATTANNGNTLFFSDDGGSTWTETASLGHDKIRGVVYVSAFGVYIVYTDTAYAITDEAAIPGHYTWTTAAFKSVATDGENLVIARTIGSTSLLEVSYDALASGTLRRLSHEPGSIYVALGGDGQFASVSGTSAGAVTLSLKAAVRL